ncbi:MAG: transcriptional regulator [bacterium]
MTALSRGEPNATYRFDTFVVSRTRRALFDDGREVPLIPRYFDLLLFLLDHRHAAVHKNEIFDAVWRDVIVSDGSLSQAVRTLRRALRDDSRNPRFIRTVSRHGYQFVYSEVGVEQESDAAIAADDATHPAGVAPRSGVGRDVDRHVDIARGRDAGVRALAASLGGAIAGAVAGSCGGLIIHLGPGSTANANLPAALALVGAAVGGLGALGVGGGVAVAGAIAHARHASRLAACAALAAGGAFGGALVGVCAHRLAVWTLEGMFGQSLDRIGGGLEGLVIGAAAGAAYALPLSPRAWRCAAIGAACSLACVALALAGGSLVGSSLNQIASAFQGSQVGLAPLAALLGEGVPGPVTRLVVGAIEGAFFGAGLAVGLTHHGRTTT